MLNGTVKNVVDYLPNLGIMSSLDTALSTRVLPGGTTPERLPCANATLPVSCISDPRTSLAVSATQSVRNPLRMSGQRIDRASADACCMIS